MPFSKDDKEWITLVLAPIKQDIETIKSTTAKTNGQVIKHEQQITEALAERTGNRQKQDAYFKKIGEIDTRVELLEKEEVAHVVNCPVNPKLRVVEDQLLVFMTDVKAEIKAKSNFFTKTNQLIILGIMLATLCLGLYNASMNTKMNKGTLHDSAKTEIKK